MKRSPEVAEVITGWFKAAERGDATWRDQHVSHRDELRIVGTDSSEWLDGEAAYAFLKNEAETVGGRATVEVRDVEAYEDGDIGWGVARPEITLGDGSQVTPRWTAVFRREDAAWKVVMLHASIGIIDEEVFGEIFAP